MERRKAQRFHINQIIQIGMFREEDVFGKGINISEEGILIETGQEIEQYTKMYIIVTIPSGKDEHQIKCEGVVTRSERDSHMNLIGIKFTDCSKADRKKIREYCSTQKKIKSDRKG